MKQLKRKISIILMLLLVFILSAPVVSNAADMPVNLGTASGFSLLAGSTITNIGTTSIAGNVGLHPGTAFSGQDTAVVGGTIHLADAVALQAKNDFFAAYTEVSNRAGNGIGAELGGSTMTPGVYSASTNIQITGTLTLDGQNNNDSIFIFKAGSTLTTASSSKIELINGANPNNIFWQVGTSATLGTNSEFKGTILAMQSVTATTGADIVGRLMAMDGAITLDNNSISNFIFVPVVETTTAETTTTETTTEEVSTTETSTESTTADVGTTDATTSESALPVTTTPTTLTLDTIMGTEVSTETTDVNAIPQTGQESNYNMAMALGGSALVFAGLGLALMVNKIRFHA